MTEKVTLVNAQQFLKKLRDEYAEKYKYNIAGQADVLFKAVGKAVSSAATFDSLRRARVQEKIALHNIDISAENDSVKLKLSANAKMSFMRAAVAAMKAVSLKGDTKVITGVIHKLATDLSAIVDNYVAGMADSPDAAKDPSFLAGAKKVADNMKEILTAQKPRLLAAQVIYSPDLNNALKALSGIQTDLAAAAGP